MEKVIRDGKVAVLISPGFGAGWSTWNYEYPEILFDPTVVAIVESLVDDNMTPEASAEIEAHVKETYGEYVYCGGAGDLTIKWLPVGTQFRVHEYDGSESIEVKEEMDWITA